MSGDEGAGVELPRGWCWAKLGELCANEANAMTDGPFGSNLKSDDYRASGVRVVRLGNIGVGRFVDKDKAYVESSRLADLAKHQCFPGDLLIAALAEPVGRCAPVPSEIGPAIVKADCIRMKPHAAVDRIYLMHCLNSPGGLARTAEASHGVGRLRINLGEIRQVLVPLAPTVEQKRIVAKLDDLLARSRATREALTAVLPLLERYRESVLAAAFRGDLTQNWRKSNPETPARSELGSWNCDIEQGTWSQDELPPGWVWASFSSTFRDHTSTERKVPQELYRSEGRYAVVDQGEQFPGGFTNDEGSISEAPLPAIVFGDHTRRTHFVDSPFAQGADGVRVLAPTALVSARFAYWLLRGISLPNKGYSRHFRFLKASRLPIPPIGEAKCICRILDELTQRSSEIRSLVETQLARLDALDRSILARAFRGELVPQDPSDEPGSALLDRLRADRAAAPAKPARRGRPAAR